MELGQKCFFTPMVPSFYQGGKSFPKAPGGHPSRWPELGHVTSSRLFTEKRQENSSDWCRPASPWKYSPWNPGVSETLRARGLRGQNNFHHNAKNLLACFHCVDICTGGAKATGGQNHCCPVQWKQVTNLLVVIVFFTAVHLQFKKKCSGETVKFINLL